MYAMHYLFWWILILVPARSEDVTKSLEANAPIEFPKNESQYHFLHNTTILKALASQTRNDTEVDDLLHGGQFNDHGLDSNNSVGLSEVNAEDAQWLQDGSDTEDMRWRSNTTRSSIKTVGERDSYGAKMPVVHSQLAAISAGVLILIAVFGYAALLFWRRYLEYVNWPLISLLTSQT